MNAISGCLRSAGRTFSEAELRVVTEVVANGGGGSRAQLMVQVCQRLQWRRPSGALKVRECRDLLLTMERDDRLRLPLKRAAVDRVARTPGCRAPAPVSPGRRCSARSGSSAPCACKRSPRAPITAGGVN